MLTAIKRNILRIAAEWRDIFQYNSMQWQNIGAGIDSWEMKIHETSSKRMNAFT